MVVVVHHGGAGDGEYTGRNYPTDTERNWSQNHKLSVIHSKCTDKTDHLDGSQLKPSFAITKAKALFTCWCTAYQAM